MTFTHSFDLGSFKAISIADQRNKRSMEYMFMEYPVEEIRQFLLEKGREDETQSDGNVLYINTGELHVLIDSGIGFGMLIEGLKSKGISPEQIDYVIITHGDGDHILGLLDAEGQSTFPNARIVMWEKAWELWTTKDGQIKMVEDFELVMRRWGSEEKEIEEMKASRPDFGNKTLTKLQSQLTLVDLEEEFIPGFHLVDGRGHRRDMVGVVITSGEETLLHVSDSIRDEIQAKYPHYICYIDSYADEMVKRNKLFFEFAYENKALMFCTHLAFPALAKITKDENSWVWETVK